MSINNIEGTRSNIIQEIIIDLLEMIVSKEKIDELCAAVEKLTDDAYIEGREDGQFFG